jgi:hypothetical protein
MNDEKLSSLLQKKLEELLLLIEHFFALKITQAVITHSVIMKEYLNEMGQVTVNSGQIRV